jgi:two-component system sensor histidine kinase KdpD
MRTAALSRRRVAAGFALASLGLPLLTAALYAVRDSLSLASDILLYLVTVVAVALVGGAWPALVAAVGGFFLLNFFFTEPLHTFSIAERDDILALAVFLVVAIAVSTVVDTAARRTREAAAASAEASTRAALLAAVGHDLRTPLAAAMAAVASLRSDDVRFSEEDTAELLATAAESHERLYQLIENLLDMSRLQAGALGVTTAAIGLEEAVPAALDEIGDEGRAGGVRIPADLPAVAADAGLLQRVLVNVLRNALRHSPAGRPPVVTASANGDRVELRIVDSGPGIPEADRDRVFQPFQRLGDRSSGGGVGLGLALSRGLTEAMGGTLVPETTPGGGLTMVLGLPTLEGV